MCDSSSSTSPPSERPTTVGHEARAVRADREARGCLAPPLLPETVACVSPGALTEYDVRNASESRQAGGLEAPDRAGPNAVGTSIGVRVPPPVSPCRAKSSPQARARRFANRSTNVNGPLRTPCGQTDVSPACPPGGQVLPRRSRDVVANWRKTKTPGVSSHIGCDARPRRRTRAGVELLALQRGPQEHPPRVVEQQLRRHVLDELGRVAGERAVRDRNPGNGGTDSAHRRTASA
jgi:hypothetical protein